jgi:hypothetical protein
MPQQDAYRMIQRHAKRAGIKTKIGNNSLRATGITDYTRTQLYDQTTDAASLTSFPSGPEAPRFLFGLCPILPTAAENVTRSRRRTDNIIVR